MVSISEKCRLYNYTDIDLDNALNDIEKGKSLRKVEKEYGIPRSTLHAKITGRVQKHCRRGSRPILSDDEENRLKQWIINKARLGFPMYTDEVKKTVQKLLNETSRKTIFTDNMPGAKWLHLFLRRHPEINKVNVEMFSKGQILVTEENLREWFQRLQNFLKENGLESVLNRPKSIFNGDEISIQLLPEANQFLESKNDKDLYTITSEEEKETLTVLCTFSAAGDALPPMIMSSNRRIPIHLTDSVIENAGCMVASTFYEYIVNIFYPWCLNNRVKFPVIYVLDGHKFRLTLELSDFCIQHNIIIYSLLPSSTHIAQPCDVLIFKALKQKWKQVVQEYKQTTEKLVTKTNFTTLFMKAFEQLSNSSIQNGFRLCGLYPFNENAVNHQNCTLTGQEELNFIDEIEESTISLTQDDFLSTKKFFDHYISKEKLQQFVDIRNKNEACDDPIYSLWKICTDMLQDSSINDETVDIKVCSTFSDNENDMEETFMEVVIPFHEEKVTICKVYEDKNSCFGIMAISVIDISNINETNNSIIIKSVSSYESNGKIVNSKFK